jgi:hypothetical protein
MSAGYIIARLPTSLPLFANSIFDVELSISFLPGNTFASAIMKIMHPFTPWKCRLSGEGASVDVKAPEKIEEENWA